MKKVIKVRKTVKVRVIKTGREVVTTYDTAVQAVLAFKGVLTIFSEKYFTVELI